MGFEKNKKQKLKIQTEKLCLSFKDNPHYWVCFNYEKWWARL